MRGNWSSPSSLMRLPLSRIVPSVGFRSAPSIKSRVVFPDPEGPMFSTTWPGSIARDTWRTAVTSVGPEPNRLVTSETCSVRLSMSLPSEDHGLIEIAYLADRQGGGPACINPGGQRRLPGRGPAQEGGGVDRQAHHSQADQEADRIHNPDQVRAHVADHLAFLRGELLA